MKVKRSVIDASPSTLIDAVMDGYVSWREESAAVETAYRAWLAAAREERSLAFAAYTAALDREEYAANEYGRLIQQAEHRR